ncbi:uncharacterized protein LOC135341252 [Halichondria panicea]|uniref:uncharacterized protein LOC135341252 n=1 Tax=Halichondria panicea TaxID=6063 RepID=UPI00312B9D49
MGNTWQRVGKRFNQQEIKIIMVGLDAAGKTTTLYKMKLGEVVTTIPTIGFNVETVNYKNINFTTWDVGGRGRVRPLWRHYYQNIDVLIFVVDSNDRDRIEECKDELWRFLTEDELKESILLVLANKQDLPNAMSTQEVTEKLDLTSIKERNWYIQGSCATKGDGLYEGLDWLKSTLTQQRLKKTMVKPVEETIPSLKNSVKNSWWTSIASYFARAASPKMGNTWQRVVKRFNQQEIKIIMVGLDAAGKTTTLYKLKLGEVVTTIPTLGFNVETVNYKNVNFITWDIGGRDQPRPLWRHYFQKADVLIFVVDSNDRDRIEEVKDELWRLLGEDELNEIILLVLANKQDLPNAMSTEEVTEKLDLTSIKERDWYIQGSCAIKGDGLYEALDWLKSTLTQQRLKKTIVKPVKETMLSSKNYVKNSWWTSLTSYFVRAE